MDISEMSFLDESVMQSEIFPKSHPDEDQEMNRKYMLIGICLIILVFLLLMMVGVLYAVDFSETTTHVDDITVVYLRPPASSYDKFGTTPTTIKTTTTTILTPATRTLTTGSTATVLIATSVSAPATSGTTKSTTTQRTTTKSTTTERTTTKSTTTERTTTKSTTTERTTTKSTTTERTTTTTTIRTTTEDSFQLQADYTQAIYKDAHNFACLFNASKQGFQAFGRTYGIAYFPFQVCHIILYCCYTLKSNMEFEPANPTVDLAPRDAVRRAADYKKNNTWLWTYLVVEGSHANFGKLMDNRSGEVNTFSEYAVNWMNRSNYDGIRILWRDTPASRNATIVTFSDAVTLALYPHKKSVGFFVPYELHLRAAYNVYILRYALRVRYTIILYHARPLRRPSKVKWLEYNDVKFSLTPENVTVRNMFCHMFPLQWHRFVLNDSSCDGRKIRTGTAGVVDWGPQGSLTQIRGLLARYEVCDMVDNTWTASRVGSAISLCKDRDVLVGLDANAARTWIKNDLHDPSNGICFGYMDPENDDFPGRCNAGNFFPLIRRMFRHFVHGKIRSGGRREKDLLLLTSDD